MVELRVTGLDRLECDVRITLIGESDTIVQMASTKNKPGFAKLIADQTRIQLTAPVRFGTVNTIKVELVEPKPRESLFVEFIRLNIDSNITVSWFYFMSWLGVHMESGKLELTSTASSSSREAVLKQKAYEIVVTTAKDAYVLDFK